MKVLKEPAFVLHSRPFADSSLIFHFFTKNYGRISLLAKGIRSSNAKRSFRGDLVLFSEIFISYSGKNELKILYDVETSANFQNPLTLSDVFCKTGFYLNELLFYLIKPEDKHPEIYDDYRNLLLNLPKLNPQEAVFQVKVFEKHLLFSLGYGLDLNQDIFGNTILDDQYYSYEENTGFKPTLPASLSPVLISGRSIRDLKDEVFHNTKVSELKSLTRFLFRHLLNRKLKSFDLF